MDQGSEVLYAFPVIYILQVATVNILPLLDMHLGLAPERWILQQHAQCSRFFFLLKNSVFSVWLADSG
jgi:hypothetical protein